MPLGNPLALKLTAPLNPLTGVTVMALMPLEPWETVRAGGFADIEKSGAAALGMVIANIAV
jgi:hypothetical protein